MQPETYSLGIHVDSMQNATQRTIILVGLAVALTMVSPTVAAATAAPEIPLETTVGDTLVHTVRAGDTLNALAVHYRAEAGWYGQADCLRAIRQANGLEETHLLHIGQQVAIPVHHDPAPVKARRQVKHGADLRGLYLPGPICGFQVVFARIDSFTAAGGNGVVFDAKDIDGGVNYRSLHPLAVWGKGRPAPVIPDLENLIDRLHQRDLWVVARLALFLDGELGRQRPDLVLRGPDGEPWAERGCYWVDPANADVREYHLSLAVELARAGVDEVQVDYVRFPTSGWRGDWQGDLEATANRRREVITGFVASLHDTLQALDCRLSADLFGIMAWDRVADLALTGQHIPSLAPHLDVICPMIYPSHFGPGFEGLENPGDHPELMVDAGVRRCREQAGANLQVRPWLQAFPWRVRQYDGQYVAAQVGAAEDAGAAGWCLWNPAGRYEVARQGLTALAAAPTPHQVVRREVGDDFAAAITAQRQGPPTP